MLRALLQRIAHRCPVHDRASYAVTARLEQELGMPVSPPPASLTEQFADPNLISCGNSWCSQRR